jgi:hypothetical protein
MPSNNALQSEKVNLSCLLLTQKPRQLAFAAELERFGGSRRALDPQHSFEIKD